MALQRRLKILDCDTDAPTHAFAITAAFASTDMETVNQHFGAAESFVIYGIDPNDSKMLEVVQFSQPTGDEEDKLSEKLDMLEGCLAVYAQAVGASAVRQLKGLGVQPVKVSPDTEISDLIKALQEELRSGPSAWLARAIKSQQSMRVNSFDEMEAEGWDE